MSVHNKTQNNFFISTTKKRLPLIERQSLNNKVYCKLFLLEIAGMRKNFSRILQHAVVTAVSEINQQANRHPDKSSFQSKGINRHNHRQANNCTEYRYKWNQWSFEWTFDVWTFDAQDPDADAYQNESQQGSKAGQIACNVARYECCE
jgi:hypothetical protein